MPLTANIDLFGHFKGTMAPHLSFRAAGPKGGLGHVGILGGAAPQGLNSQLLSFFRAVPKLPRWYTDTPTGENVNASNFSSSISFR
jgi:hypothetical protein